MANELLSIPIDSIKREFDDFLDPDSNKRIIFSGPFGIGKTYFLTQYFQDREIKYYPVFLRPVNYSLLSNEDIFKLIKYDIIYEIIKEIDINNEFEFSKLEYSSTFLHLNKYLILKNLLRHIPVIKQGIEISQDVDKLVEAYQRGWNHINKSKNQNFLKDFYEANENHFLLEFDHVSKFISDQLDDIAIRKGGSENKLQKVLIIDDLDRLDPEHIFRLFNVFSAHFDHANCYSNGEVVKDNKFGFDKIIFVCDIENIRKLFSHKYGLGVDFSGYIDKFYSQQIYFLYHKNSFKKHILGYIEQQFNQSPLNYNIQNKKTLLYLLQILFDGNQLNIRDLARFSNIQLSELIAKDDKIRNLEVQVDKIGAPIHSFVSYYPICVSVYFLAKLYGNSSIFLEKLQKAITKASIESNDYEYETYEFLRLLPLLILFADHKNHQFKINKEKDPTKEKSYEYLCDVEFKIKYKISGQFIDRYHDEGPMYFEVFGIENNLKISKGLFLKTITSAAKEILELELINI